MNSMIPTPSLNNCFLCDVTGIRSGICQGTFPKGCFLFLGIYIIWVPCIKWNFLPENSTAIGLFLFISLASHVTASFLTHGFWELGGILVIVRLTPLSHRWGHCSLPRFCSEVDKGTGLELSLPQCMHFSLLPHGHTTRGCISLMYLHAHPHTYSAPQHDGHCQHGRIHGKTEKPRTPSYVSLLPPWEHRNSCVSDLSSALETLSKKEN